MIVRDPNLKAAAVQTRMAIGDLPDVLIVGSKVPMKNLETFLCAAVLRRIAVQSLREIKAA